MYLLDPCGLYALEYTCSGLTTETNEPKLVVWKSISRSVGPMERLQDLKTDGLTGVATSSKGSTSREDRSMSSQRVAKVRHVPTYKWHVCNTRRPESRCGVGFPRTVAFKIAEDFPPRRRKNLASGLDYHRHLFKSTSLSVSRFSSCGFHRN